MSNKETYYLVLPATSGKYKFGSMKRDTEDALITPSFAAIFEKNPTFDLQTVDDGSNLYVTDIFSGLEELVNINPLNEEIFSQWANRFDYLALIMQSLGLQKHLPYVISDANPTFGKWKGDPKLTLIKIARKSNKENNK